MFSRSQFFRVPYAAPLLMVLQVLLRLKAKHGKFNKSVDFSYWRGNQGAMRTNNVSCGCCTSTIDATVCYIRGILLQSSVGQF